MAAKTLLGRLSRPGLQFLCRSASSAWGYGRLPPLNPPGTRECSGLNYYKNMHDSLIEIYTDTASSAGEISATRFMNVRKPMGF